jgi:hypothetical protein
MYRAATKAAYRQAFLKETAMKSLCRYVDEHHEEYGIALFIVPVLLVTFVVVSGFCAASALLAM